jgi:hypothetical protein
MTDRNWEAELAKIDKQLSSVSDEQLLAEQRKAAAPALPPGKPVPVGAAAPAVKVAPVGKPAAGAWASWLKVTVAIAAAAGLMFWPWPPGLRCGVPLLGYTAATAGVTLLGIWSALGTWRHRLGLAHAASLIVVVWGLVLGAREVLPRAGYAIPTLERGAGWTCDALPPAAPASSPSPTPPATSPSGTPIR